MAILSDGIDETAERVSAANSDWDVENESNWDVNAKLDALNHTIKRCWKQPCGWRGLPPPDWTRCQLGPRVHRPLSWQDTLLYNCRPFASMGIRERQYYAFLLEAFSHCCLAVQRVSFIRQGDDSLDMLDDRCVSYWISNVALSRKDPGGQYKDEESWWNEQPAIITNEEQSHSAHRSRPMGSHLNATTDEQKDAPFVIYVLLGGKDMVALDWLPWVSKYLHYLKHSRQADPDTYREPLKLGTSTRNRDSEPRRLESRLGFVLVEFPGYGGTEGVPSRRSCLECSVKSLKEVLSRIAPSKPEVRVIGYSLGTAVALNLVSFLQKWIAAKSLSSATTLCSSRSSCGTGSNYSRQPAESVGGGSSPTSSGGSSNMALRNGFKASRHKYILHPSTFSRGPPPGAGRSFSEPKILASTASLDVQTPGSRREQPDEDLFLIEQAQVDEIHPLDKVKGVRGAVLLAPFTRIEECAVRWLPKSVHGLLVPRLLSSNFELDNVASLSCLIKILTQHGDILPDFNLTIVHGSKDITVPPSMGRELVRLGESMLGHQDNTAGISFEYVEVSGAEHTSLVIECLFQRRVFEILSSLDSPWLGVAPALVDAPESSVSTPLASLARFDEFHPDRLLDWLPGSK